MIVFNIEVYIHRTDVDDDQIYDDSFSPNKIEDDLSRKKTYSKARDIGPDAQSSNKTQNLDL